MLYRQIICAPFHQVNHKCLRVVTIRAFEVSCERNKQINAMRDNKTTNLRKINTVFYRTAALTYVPYTLLVKWNIGSWSSEATRGQRERLIINLVYYILSTRNVRHEIPRKNAIQQILYTQSNAFKRGWSQKTNKIRQSNVVTWNKQRGKLLGGRRSAPRDVQNT